MWILFTDFSLISGSWFQFHVGIIEIESWIGIMGDGPLASLSQSHESWIDNAAMLQC